MPFLSGSVSGVQFSADWPDGLNGDEVSLLSRFAAEPCVFGADGESCGWAAGRHKRDCGFAGEQNVFGEFLAFDFRRTQDKLPGDLMRQYVAEELAAVAAANDGRLPSARQKREAREAARSRLEEEARDGRFRRHTLVPVVWDRGRGRVWFGSASVTLVDRFTALFERTFGVTPARVDGATLAGPQLAGLATEFVPGVTPPEYAWVPSIDHPTHLGNEFALWLMWRADGGAGDAVPGYAVMVHRTLTLECPRGQTGRETVTHEGPVRLPEVRKALQAGKLPTKLGLIVVRHQEQYEFTLAADLWAVGGGKVPKPGDDLPTEPAQQRVCRLEAVRGLFDALGGLYGEFLAVRRSPAAWEGEVAVIRTWLGVGES